MLFRLQRDGEAQPHLTDGTVHPVKRQLTLGATVVTVVLMTALVLSFYETPAMGRPPAVAAVTVSNLESYSLVVAENHTNVSQGDLGENRPQTLVLEPMMGHDPWQGTVWAGYCAEQCAGCCAEKAGFRCPPCIERQTPCTPVLFEQIDSALKRLSCIFKQPCCTANKRTAHPNCPGCCKAGKHSKSQCHCSPGRQTSPIPRNTIPKKAEPVLTDPLATAVPSGT
jgi:hypothetical protein